MLKDPPATAGGTDLPHLRLKGDETACVYASEEEKV